jgi:hypothetical protein
MGMWGTSKARRGIAAVALAAGLTLSVAGCSFGGDDDDPSSGSSETAEENGNADGGQEANGEEVPQDPIAEVKNRGDVALRVMELKRDSGGFVTLNGEIENTGSETYSEASLWGGSEEGADKTSLMGATLVDKSGKKRYYVLRDTEKRCLCTSGIQLVEPEQAIPIYIQFPAPPEDTQEVEFQLPTFPPTTLEISD